MRHTTIRRRSQPDPVLEEIRWLFENSSISLSQLSRRYTVARTTLQYRISTEEWQRYVAPADPEQRARDLLAVQARAGNSAAVRARARADSAGGDAGVPPFTAAAISPLEAMLPNSAGPAAGQVIAFPGPGVAQEKYPDNCTGAAGTPPRVHKRTGMPRRRNADPIGAFQAMIDDYVHLLQVYLNPDQYAETEGLDPAEAEAAVMKLQALARAVLLPTERDSLASAMKVGALGIATLANLLKAAGGSNSSSTIGTGAHASEDGSVEIDKLSIDELVTVQAAINILNGVKTRPSEPPMPPPPEPLPWMPR